MAGDPAIACGITSAIACSGRVKVAGGDVPLDQGEPTLVKGETLAAYGISALLPCRAKNAHAHLANAGNADGYQR